MGAVAQDILERSLRHKLGLLRWDNDLLLRVIGLLNRTDSDLEQRISVALESNLAEESTTRLRNIRTEIRSVNVEAYGLVRKELSSELQEAVKRQASFYASMLSKSVPFAFSPTRPSAYLLRSIVTSQPFQGALLRDHVAKLAGNRLDAMISQMEIGLAQSESLSQLMQRIRGTRRGGFRDGVLHTVGRGQLERFIRTAAQHTTESAREMLFRDNDDLISGTMWVSTLDHRTCPLCQPRDGLVWNWTGKGYRPRGHDLAWIRGPGKAHWQCRCTGVPVLKGIAALGRDGFDVSTLGSQQRAAMSGPVPVTQDYPSWLREQTFEIQSSALGSVRRAQQFRSGATLDEVWSQKFVPQLAIPASLDDILPIA